MPIELTPGQRPLWGANPVDAELEEIHPLPGWLLLTEVFKGRQHAIPNTAIVLEIVKPYIHNTVFGTVVAIHQETAESLGVEIGDEVVYREYSGGRWAFHGERALITPADDILAVIER